jgi:hypothetical protein
MKTLDITKQIERANLTFTGALETNKKLRILLNLNSCLLEKMRFQLNLK